MGVAGGECAEAIKLLYNVSEARIRGSMLCHRALATCICQGRENGAFRTIVPQGKGSSECSLVLPSPPVHSLMFSLPSYCHNEPLQTHPYETSCTDALGIAT